MFFEKESRNIGIGFTTFFVRHYCSDTRYNKLPPSYRLANWSNHPETYCLPKSLVTNEQLPTLSTSKFDHL